MNYINELDHSQKINLYRLSLGYIKNRLSWDLTFKSFRSKQYFTKKRNIHSHKKAVILCNGPSLRSVDFDLLNKSSVFTIGLNKINLLFEETSFRPNMIVSVNKLVVEQNKDFFNNTEIELIIDSKSSKIIRPRSNVHFIHSLPFQLKFAGDIRGSVCQGYTVTYVALQIAFHYGFDEVAIVGCDHNFETKGSANMTIVSSESDPNHFSSKYFSDGMKWQLPDLPGSELHYRMAKEYYEAYNRKIWNCTDGGKLEVFNRKQLEFFLNEPIQ